MKAQIKTHINIEVRVNSCTMLSGYITKKHAERAKQGFKTMEECNEYSDKYGIYTCYYTAHVYFKGNCIASSKENKNEQKAIRQAYALAKEYFNN